MAAYLIISARISDPQAFGVYAERAAQLVAQFGGRYLVLGAAARALEGVGGDAADSTNGTPGTSHGGSKWVISEWPDGASARRFWESAEYSQAKRLREGTGQFEVRLLEGGAAPKR